MTFSTSCEPAAEVLALGADFATLAASGERGLCMRIKDILRHKGSDVVTIGAHETVNDAIRKLNQHGIGALIVTGEGGQICGIITERDVLRECGERCTRHSEPREPGETYCPTLIGDVMTKDLVIGVPDDHLDYVMGIMTKNRIRHLPVIDREELVGIISIGDVVEARLDDTAVENRFLKGYVQG
jgi:CBS domain-containing protein